MIDYKLFHIAVQELTCSEVEVTFIPEPLFYSGATLLLQWGTYTWVSSGITYFAGAVLVHFPR